jgi:phage gpG-like protein
VDFYTPFEKGMNTLDAAIVKKILSNIPPPNAASTVAKKGSSKTLVDSGDMYRAVKHEIKGEGINLVGTTGIFNEEIAKYAYWNEYGTKKGIPARPFLTPAFDKTAPKVAEEIAEDIFKQIEKNLGW